MGPVLFFPFALLFLFSCRAAKKLVLVPETRGMSNLAPGKGCLFHGNLVEVWIAISGTKNIICFSYHYQIWIESAHPLRQSCSKQCISMYVRIDSESESDCMFCVLRVGHDLFRAQAAGPIGRDGEEELGLDGDGGTNSAFSTQYPIFAGV